MIVLIVIIVAAILLHIYLRITLKRCVSNASLVGKVVIVTGANSGIGYETAKDLAARGGRIILACRSESRGINACQSIITKTGNKDVIFKQLDLASLESVRKFAKDILNTETRLDVLVNNAGMYGGDDNFTEDGILEGMQVNYFGPFLLTLLLLPLLKRSRPSRIVNVSSMAHLAGVVNFEKINKIYYNRIRLYINNKLCNVIFTVELSRRLQGTGVTVNSMHPGIISTNILQKDNAHILLKYFHSILCALCMRTAEEGAQTIIHLAVSEDCDNVSGKYFMDCRQTFSSCFAHNRDLAQKLWKYSEELVQYRIQN